MPEYTAQEKEYFKTLFRIADNDKDGKIGPQDAAFFRKSGVPDALLGKIWQTSTNGSQPYLTEEDFYIALRLIALSQQGKEFNRESANTFPGRLPTFPEYPPQVEKQAFSNSSSNLPSAGSQWVITPTEREKYIEYFKAADTDKDGFVTGVEARALFGKSGLDNADLAKIWKLSDVTADMKLDQEEFILAMFLINCKRKGMEIPNSLPPTLVPSKGTQQPASVTSGTTTQKYSIPAEEKTKYQDIFKRSGPIDGYVTGELARNLFGKSGLSNVDLGKIWLLSDVDKDGRLSEPEFVIAMYFIYGRRAGMELPNELPESVKIDVGLSAPTSITPPPTSTTPPPEAKKKLGNYDINLDEVVGGSSASNSATSLPSVTTALPPSMGSTSGFGSTTENALVVHGSQVPSNDGFGSSNFGGSGFGDFGNFGNFGSTPSGLGAQPSTSSASTPSLTPSQSFSGSSKSLPQYSAAKATELTKVLAEEKSRNSELEREVATEQASLDSANVDLREVETKVSEEKAKGAALKEQIKYVRLQIKAVKEQREQFERILKEKKEQQEEEEELFQILQNELNEKKAEIEKLQQEISNITSGTESMRQKRKETREQLSSLKSKMEELTVTKKQASETSTPITSAPASPAAQKKEVSTASPAITPKQETTPVKQETPSSGFGFDSGFDSFGEKFGSDPFTSAPSATTTTSPSTTSKPAIPPKPAPKKEEDPFSFSSDLSSETFVDTQKEAFGGQVEQQTPFSAGFGNDNFGGGGFGNETFGSGGFGNDAFGSFDTFGSATSATQPGNKKDTKTDSGFESAFSFPSNVVDFDTGKDSFG